MTVLFIYAKAQATATSHSYFIAKYMPETNMHLELGTYAIYAIYLIDIYQACMRI